MTSVTPEEVLKRTGHFPQRLPDVDAYECVGCGRRIDGATTLSLPSTEGSLLKFWRETVCLGHRPATMLFRPGQTVSIGDVIFGHVVAAFRGGRHLSNLSILKINRYQWK